LNTRSPAPQIATRRAAWICSLVGFLAVACSSQAAPTPAGSPSAVGGSAPPASGSAAPAGSGTGAAPDASASAPASDSGESRYSFSLRTLAPGATFRFPGHASRVVVQDLGIDLPVVSGDLEPPPGNYPLCDVAQWLTAFAQPGMVGTTYLYAHAREGMFGPLLSASLRSDGAELIGLTADVYTSDNMLYHYRIFEVERHSTTYRLANAFGPDEQRLILQTSEGPYGTAPKLVVAATLIDSEPADPSAANPEPEPRDCRPPELIDEEGGIIDGHPDAGLASRVAVPSLGIDLPVVSGALQVPGNPPDYPLCDVAQYQTDYQQPGEEGTTYLYAHAQEGMFLPLLEESQDGDGSGLIGLEVLVYTELGELYRFEVTEFEREATDFGLADGAGSGESRLILQTSIGPSGTVPKLVVAARLVSSEPVDVAEATPAALPRVCA